MKEEAQNLVDELNKLCEGLWYLSESDFPLEAFYWEGLEYEEDAFSLEAEKVITYLEEDTNLNVAEKSFGDFFLKSTTAKDWYGEEEKAEVEKFKKLLAFLEENLEHLQVILLGKIEIKAYVFGKTSFGGVAGVKTQLVQT